MENDENEGSGIKPKTVAFAIGFAAPKVPENVDASQVSAAPEKGCSPVAPPSRGGGPAPEFVLPEPLTGHERNGRILASFVLRLLRSFEASYRYGIDRLGIRPRSRGNLKRSSSLSATNSMLQIQQVSQKEKDRALLRLVFNLCIENSRDVLCDVLGIPYMTEDRVKEALEGSGQPAKVTSTEVARALEAIEETFSSISRSLTLSKSKRRWVSSYNPDWKTRNLVWELVRSGLGSTNPPTAETMLPLGALKDAVFATLFKGDFLLEQRKNSRFRNTLMRHIPRPGAWDADVGFLAVSFFISVPVASVFVSANGIRLGYFWVLVSILFVASSLAIVLIYAKYSSWYCTRLLDSAAVGGEGGNEGDSFERCHDNFGSSSSTPSSTGFSFTDTPTERNADDTVLTFETVEETPATTIGSEAVERVKFPSCWGRIENSEGRGGTTKRLPPTSNHSASDDDVSLAPLPQNLLRLYQVSMMVERLNASYYFADDMMLGLSESQVYNAIYLSLESDRDMGQSLAGFAFTSLVITSRGITVDQGSEFDSLGRFSFAIYGILAASAFLCGLTAAVFSDIVLRQLSLTNTKEENTGHYFASQFGSFLRLIGGLNSFSGMFLSTALFQFLVSIFQVSPYAALPLGLLWIIVASLMIEAFTSKSAYWHLSEVFDDIAETVETPTDQSPSPVTGILQILRHRVRRLCCSEHENEE